MREIAAGYQRLAQITYERNGRSKIAAHWNGIITPSILGNVPRGWNSSCLGGECTRLSQTCHDGFRNFGYSGTYRAFHGLFVIGGMEMQPGAADW